MNCPGRVPGCEGFTIGAPDGFDQTTYRCGHKPHRAPDRELPCYSADRFTWHRGEGHADASDFGLKTGAWIGSKIWNDSIDLGFIAYNPRTGRRMVFVHSKTITQDGEIKGWEYEGENGIRITIAND